MPILTKEDIEKEYEEQCMNKNMTYFLDGTEHFSYTVKDAKTLHFIHSIRLRDMEALKEEIEERRKYMFEQNHRCEFEDGIIRGLEFSRDIFTSHIDKIK